MGWDSGSGRPYEDYYINIYFRIEIDEFEEDVDIPITIYSSYSVN